MSNALAIVPPQQPSASLALEPTDLDSAYKVAQLLSASKMLGAASRSPESTLAVIMTGRELGLTAMQSLRSINFENGKPIMAADLMVALVRRSPLCKSWQLIETTGAVATYETHRAGDVKPTRMSYTIEQAKTAGLLGKTNWKQHPEDMLRARASSKLCRAVYPDLLMGFYDPDEIGPSEARVPDLRREVEEINVFAEAQGVHLAQYEEDKAAFGDEVAQKLGECADVAAVAQLASYAQKRAKELGLTKDERKRIADAFQKRREELLGLASTDAPEPPAEAS